MKKIILSLILLSTGLIGYSQFNVGIGGGMNVVKPMFVASASIGCEVGANFLVEGAMAVHATANKDYPGIFMGRVGYLTYPLNRITLIPKAGAALIYHSSDNKDLNYWKPTFSLEGNYSFRNGAQPYAEVMKAGKHVIVSVGVRCQFRQYDCL